MVIRKVSGGRFLTGLIVIGITTTNGFSLNKEFEQLPDTFQNIVYDPHIRSVWLGSSEWEFSLPVIELNSDQKLELRFDDLNSDSRTFGYTFIHCNSDWTRSQLLESEYITGFGKGTIRESMQAYNTTYFYLNYRLQLPESDCIPAVSGNFALVVFDEAEPDHIVFTRRFFVTENTMEIKAAVHQPAFGMERLTGQQVHFSVHYGNLDIRDPQREISTVVIQNNRFDKILRLDKAYSVKAGQLDFTEPEGNLFSGGNEFRTLDIKSMRYQTENIAEIDFRNPYYHVVLKTDLLRANKPWFSKIDLNGSYYIDKEKSNDRHTEADYVYVHFSLELPPLYASTPVYLAGGFNDWKSDSASLMRLNPENELFEITILMKQGLYDYCFLMKNSATRIIDEYEIEGSFYETENDYSIFVYFHDQFKRYDRLTGYLSIK